MYSFSFWFATFFAGGDLLILADASSGAFLAQGAGAVSRTEVEHSLIAELSAALEGRRSVNRVESEMWHMFASLPKNRLGNLERSTVRYALHRYFVQRHGWYIKGLDPAGAAWSNVTSDEIAKDKVPEYIQGLFEERLGNHGLGLREIAIFAATLEDLVHQEAASGLRQAYVALDLPFDEPVAPQDAERAIAAHMMTFIAGGDLAQMSRHDLKRAEREIAMVYPAWHDTLSWTQDMRRNAWYANRNTRNPFVRGVDFASTEKALDEISDNFGAFQDSECRGLKDTLLGMEYKGSGRVRLTDFWGKGLNGDWQFTESEDYLRQLGALDETGGVKSVVIPNYLSSASNCIASSSFFSVCCRDECESLLGHIEREVKTSTADPSQIVEIVSALESDTVEDVPRKLSDDLLKRLSEIADRHDQKIPIHGRLFAQWMHHAYPRECPFPNVAGTTNPLTPAEWMAQTGGATIVTQDELAATASKESGQDMGNALESLPWTTHEELVWDEQLQIHESFLSTRTLLRSVVFIVLLSAVASFLFRAMRESIGGPEQQKIGYMV
jgi:hypothetical protein